MPHYTLTNTITTSLHPTDPNSLFIQIKTEANFVGKAKAQHYTFLIDKSGSMGVDSKMDLVKESVIKLIHEYITNEDSFSVVVFDTVGNLIVEPMKKEGVGFAQAIYDIKQIECSDGTAIEEGLRECALSIKNFVLDDEATNNCIILLTDGANDDDISAQAMLAIMNNILGPKIPLIIPLGMGDTYNENLLTELGEQSGCNGVVHISNPTPERDSVAIGFEKVTELARLLRMRTDPIQYQVKYVDTLSLCSMGSISSKCPGIKVFKFPLLDKKNEAPSVTLLNMSGGPAFSASINLNELLLNPDTVARFVASELNRINQQDISLESKAAEIESELLPIFKKIEYAMNNPFIKKTYGFVMAAIAASDKDEFREAMSGATLSQSYGLTTSQSHAPVLRSQKIVPYLSKYTTTYNSIKHTVGLFPQNNGVDDIAITYKILGSDINFVNSAPSRKLISLHTELQKNREGILIDFDSELIKHHQLTLNTFIKDRKYNNTLSKLRYVASYVKQVFIGTDIQRIYDQEKSNALQLKLVNGNYQLSISLDAFISGGQGVCRHEAPFVALLILGLINAEVLPKGGSIRQFRGPALNGYMAYVWTIYHAVDGLYLIDPSSDKQQVYNLSIAIDRKRALVHYTERGYPGVLDEFLNGKDLLTLDEQTPISDELLSTVLDENGYIIESEFEEVCKQNDYRDMLSLMLIKCPVRIQNPPGSAKKYQLGVFDIESLLTWLKHSKTNPFSSEMFDAHCKIVPAPEVATGMVRLIVKHNRKNIIDGNPIVVPVEKIQKLKKQRQENIEKRIADTLTLSQQQQIAVVTKKRKSPSKHVMFQKPQQQEQPQQQPQQQKR